MQIASKKNITQASADLVAQYLAKNSVTKIQPAAVTSEMSRSTRELVAARRKEFRKAQKG